jgi:hypothetical protein
MGLHLCRPNLVGQMLIGKMSVDQMLNGKMSIDQMSFGQVPVGQRSVGLTSCRPKFGWPNVSWPNVSWPNVSRPNVERQNVDRHSVSWHSASWPNVCRLKVSWPNVSRPYIMLTKSRSAKCRLANCWSAKCQSTKRFSTKRRCAPTICFWVWLAAIISTVNHQPSVKSQNCPKVTLWADFMNDFTLVIYSKLVRFTNSFFATACTILCSRALCHKSFFTVVINSAAF